MQTKDDDEVKLTPEWLLSVGFYHEADYGGEPGWYAKEFDDGTPDWITVSPSAVQATIVNDYGGHVDRPCVDRGDVRRLWYGLTGKSLE